MKKCFKKRCKDCLAHEGAIKYREIHCPKSSDSQMRSNDISEALSNVLFERKRQDEKWGEQNHYPDKWMLILTEEVGEAAKALLECELLNYRDEMVQVAAVALAAVEAYDRHKWQARSLP